MEEPDLQRVDIVAPAWMAGFWRETVGFVRRLAGTHLPPGACLEMVLAEVAEGVAPPEEDQEEEPSAPDGVHASARRSPEDAEPSSAAWPPREVHASAREARGDPRASSPEAAPGGLASEAGPDARAIDRALRDLFKEKQRQDLLLADHLRLVALDRGYRDLGFASLEAYAADRFGLSHGSLYNLLALRRRLEALPALRAAFLDGRLTGKQATLVGGVATVVCVEAWVRRAERVTLRRLEDEVDYVRHLRESRPEVWDLLEGGPLPEGIVLAPGRPPRLQESAPPPTGAQALTAISRAVVAEPEAEAEVHASTPPPEGQPASRKSGPLTAEVFLRILEKDEQMAPLPERLVVIRLWVEPDVREMWEATLAHLRSTVRSDLREWEALGLLLKEFWSVWDTRETRRQRRENPILELHGWRCAAPGCRSIGTGRLHLHHTIPRSQGGTDDPSILAPGCAAHHLGLIHRGLVRCSGWAPDGLVWEMGLEPGREPFQVFLGETRIGGAAD